MSYVADTLSNLIHQTAFFNLTWGNYLMIVVACVFLYLAIAKGFEPLLLVPIAFGAAFVLTWLFGYKDTNVSEKTESVEAVGDKSTSAGGCTKANAPMTATIPRANPRCTVLIIL